MPRVNLNQVRGLPDIIATDNFQFIIGSIPGGSTDQDMVLKCQQCIYPGMGQEAFEVPLHGFTLYFRGRKTYPRQMQITYVEDRYMDTTIQLESWFEFIVGSISGVSQDYKSGYAVDGPQLITYDNTGTEIKNVTFYGVQPQDKPDVQYDGSNSGLYIITVTFNYDFYLPSLISIN